MSSYKKYIMMGATTILLPLGKLLLNKMFSKSAEGSDEEYGVEKNGEDGSIRRTPAAPPGRKTVNIRGYER